MNKKINIIKNILLFIFIFFLCLAIASTNWALKTFRFESFDEVLFQLITPMHSASSVIINSFLIDSLLFAFIQTIIIFPIVFLLFHYLNCDSINMDIKIFNKELNHSFKGKNLRRCLRLFIFIITIGSLYYCLDNIHFIDYCKAQMDDSTFIEDNYVDPNNVKITFPEEKRNLIYIYAESMESTFFSKELGGESDYNYIEPLNDITASNISFSDKELFGGATATRCTTWTTSAIIAHTSGLPLKNYLGSSLEMDSILSKAKALGNILEENGYNQMFMMGSDKYFGNRSAYLDSHGNYEIYDYYTAIEKGKIPSDHYVWWGIEDSLLFEIAKDEILNLASKDEPFNFTILTTDSHTPDGYLEEGCPTLFPEAYGNALYCSTKQIEEFVKWIEEQDFYQNTTIVIVGDHASMQEGFYPDGTDRKVYNIFINSAVQEGNFKNRQFSTMDLFPTTLASIGASIEGDKLGLGTNLFSDKKTLLEEVGLETVNKEIAKYSDFYIKNFYYS